jgi:hypothetical protein
MLDMATVVAQLIKEKENYLRRGLELANQPMETKELKDLYAALAKASIEFKPILKDSKGYNYKYAQLDAILNMVRPVLSKHGLFLHQFTRDALLITRLAHSSGQWMQSALAVPPPTEGGKMSVMQELGSRRTYARRMEVLSILGIHPEDEDDDNQTGRNSTPAERNQGSYTPAAGTTKRFSSVAYNQ